MSNSIRWVRNEGKAPSRYAGDFTCENACKVAAWHQSFPEYEPTPLVDLPALASELGVASIHVKDESFRFGLNAFKVLGGSYALGRFIAERLGEPIANLPYDAITSEDVRRRLGELTFVTATDGNHGRGVAWTANRLGQRAVVYMPKGSSLERLENIRALGAQAQIVDMNYDDAVRLAASRERELGWVLIQDTAWSGYEKIPLWIMQGYTTMALEAVHQLDGLSPTHVFLQAGVGAMSGAVAALLADCYGSDKPVVTVVEPDQADCVYRTAAAHDGKLHTVAGDMDSIMAGLCCGEPCSIGWNILQAYADYFVSMPDWVAAQGMRVLANPLGSDARIVSGESGAATMGLVSELLRNPILDQLKREIGLGPDSRILCISTEGDTDRENYRRIVWDGAYPKPGESAR
ncbi:diaminopropionate ammonia-lyase [Slackia heliotrinireducens]|uniref:diaminopropionate ammonia-lyase n=1 Tax=Slackia heliotrinireducens TaxID=84110 RepID=UPI00331547C9